MRRFIDTEDWNQAFRKLDSKLKVLWFYMWKEADSCGVYTLDPDYLKLETNEKYTAADFKKLGEKVVEFRPGKFLFVDFILINYGTLRENYNPHKPVFRDLLKNNLEINSSLNQACFKLEEEDKDKEEYKEEEEGKEEGSVLKKNNVSKDHLFEDSTFSDFVLFEKEFAGTDYEFCDLRIYYEKVKNWSKAGGNKKKDWIATTRNFMLKDKQDGKLILKPGTHVNGDNQTKSEFGAAIDERFAKRYGSKSASN